MEAVSGNAVQIIYGLLPGFLTAWIFYSFTAHPKAAPFERVVQALVFTALIQALVRLLEIAWQLGSNSELPIASSDLVITIPMAIVVGGCLSFSRTTTLFIACFVACASPNAPHFLRSGTAYSADNSVGWSYIYQVRVGFSVGPKNGRTSRMLDTSYSSIRNGFLTMTSGLLSHGSSE